MVASIFSLLYIVWLFSKVFSSEYQMFERLKHEEFNKIIIVSDNDLISGDGVTNYCILISVSHLCKSSIASCNCVVNDDCVDI